MYSMVMAALLRWELASCDPEKEEPVENAEAGDVARRRPVVNARTDFIVCFGGCFVFTLRYLDLWDEDKKVITVAIVVDG